MSEKQYRIVEVFNTLQGEGSWAGRRAVFVRFAGCNAWNGRTQDRAKGRGACALWCDTDFAKGKKRVTHELLGLMDDAWPANPREGAGRRSRRCVLTGGEPCLQLDKQLIAAMRGRGWEVSVETNGSIDCDALELCDLVTVSPKLGLGVNWTSIKRAEASAHRPQFDLKVVLPGVHHNVDEFMLENRTSVISSPATDWRVADLDSLAHGLVWALKYVQPRDPGSIDVGDTHLSRSDDARHLPMHRAHGREYSGAVQRCIEFVMAHPEWSLSLQLHKVLGLP
jgi:organic radical activating enzyme